MEKTLKDVSIFSIMKDDELQTVLDRINQKDTFKTSEVHDLLRQILHWRFQYRHERKLLKRTIESRNRCQEKLRSLID